VDGVPWLKSGEGWRRQEGWRHLPATGVSLSQLPVDCPVLRACWLSRSSAFFPRGICAALREEMADGSFLSLVASANCVKEKRSSSVGFRLLPKCREWLSSFDYVYHTQMLFT